MTSSPSAPESAPASAATPTRARKKERHLYFNATAGALFMNVGPKEFGYWLDALPHQMGAAVRCWRMTKFLTCQKPGEPDSYDVMVNPSTGTGQCHCLGMLRWGHRQPCKHVAALLALYRQGKLS